MLSTCRGAIKLAEIKPVEPEEASTSVGNKRVYRKQHWSLMHKVIAYIHLLVSQSWLNVFPDVF